MTSFVTVPDHAAKYERLRDEMQRERIVQLEAALQKARPYVKEFADNCPSDDGGDEAVADLAVVDAALQAR